MPQARRSGARPGIRPWSGSPAESTFLWSLVGSQAYYIGLTNNATDFGTSGSYAKLGAYDYGAEMNDLVPASGVPAATTLSISSITYSGTGGLTANVTTTTNHGLTAGQEVVIAGATQFRVRRELCRCYGYGFENIHLHDDSAPGVNASGHDDGPRPTKRLRLRLGRRRVFHL